MLPARAHRIELLKNKKTAASKIGLRPKMSDKLAHIGPPAAVANRYADPIQTYPLEDFKSEAIVGIAVATIL